MRLTIPGYLRKRQGFTLSEMLVSMAVLALLVLLITQVLNSATTVITRGRKGIDSDTEARIAFDRIATDFARMQRRKDIDFYGKDTSRTMSGNDQIAFYSDVPGYYTDSSPSPTAAPTRNQRNPTSLVAYSVSSDLSGRPQLVRLAKGLTWESDRGWKGIAHLPIPLLSRWPNLFSPGAPGSPTYNGMLDSDFEVISDSVVRFEYCYVLQSTSTSAGSVSFTPYNTSISGHSTTDFGTDVAGIIVALAFLDSTSRVIVTDYSQLTSQTLFPDATTADITTSWMTAVNQPTFAATAGVPKTAASAVRVYQRRFSFTGATD